MINWIRHRCRPPGKEPRGQRIRKILSLATALLAFGTVAQAAPGVDVVLTYTQQQGFPGQLVQHTFIFVNNTGDAADTFDISSGSTQGWHIELRNALRQILAEDTNGDGTWDIVNTGADSDGDGAPDTGAIAAGNSEVFDLVIYIPGGATLGTVDTMNFTATSSLDTNVADTETMTTTVVSTTGLCNCGYGDGIMASNTGIGIDGSMSDWTTVLADLDNNTCDGASTQNVTWLPQPDLDAPVQSSGRDLSQFAFTWDSTNVQTFTARIASDSNVQRFIYYADTNNNQKMETGERVIVAQWKGSNRSVQLYYGTYVQANAGGDSMVDANGLGDGYKLPGSATGFPPVGQPNQSGFWGSTSGTQMEWAVPWTVFGIPAGTAFSFHVSSTNSQPGAASFPAQVDDNMGGCGGRSVSNQYAGVTFVNNETINTEPPSTECQSHVLTNTGNGTDGFTFSTSSSGDFDPDSVTIWQDLGTVGTLDASDVNITSTGTGDMVAGATMNILICYNIGFSDVGTSTVVTTATSNHDVNKSAAVTDTIISVAKPDFTVLKQVSMIDDHVNAAGDFYIPGADIKYTITVTNAGPGSSDAGTWVMTDAIPTHLKMYVGDYVGGGGGPVDFTPGTSTLVYTFTSLGSITDSIGFKNAGGTAITPDDASDGGFDDAVRSIEITPTGSFAPWSGSGAQPSLTIEFRARIK